MNLITSQSHQVAAYAVHLAHLSTHLHTANWRGCKVPVSHLQLLCVLLYDTVAARSVVLMCLNSRFPFRQ